jgi:hypothetical protein
MEGRIMKGQIALVVLIVSTIVLTLGLSLSRKTVVETKIDTDEELLKQAFNNAESGIDYFIATGSTLYESDDGTDLANVTASDIGGTRVLTSDGLVLQNEPIYFWMVGHNDSDGSLNMSDYYLGNTVNICVDSSFDGLVYSIYLYKDGSEYKTERMGYSFGSSPVSGFTAVSSPVACNSGKKGVAYDLKDSPVLLVLSPFSKGTNIELEGASNFPVQGKDISAIGKAGEVSTQGVKRKVRVKKLYEVPSFLMEGITASGVVNN